MLALLPLLAPTISNPAVLDAPSALALPPVALATSPAEGMPQLEYTYIEANYVWTDFDATDEDLTGFEVTGSLELPLNLFAQLTYSQLSDDSDLSLWRIGAGWHFGLGERIDAYGILSFVTAELEDSVSDFDEDGVAGEVGVRFLLTPKLELNADVEWVNIDEDDFGVGAGARWYLIDALSLGGRVEQLDEDVTFLVGARFEL